MTQPLAAIDLVTGAARIAGLAVLAGTTAGAVAAVHRWYAADTVPEGLSALAGLAVVAVYLNTTAALGQVIGGANGLLDPSLAVVNGATFVAAAAAAAVGRRVGDRGAQQLGVITGARTLDTEVNRVVRAVGRVITVTLPDADDIEDLEGYDPVPADTKRALAGKTLLFPSRLTVGELRDRLAARLKEDYGVGRVGVDLAEDGTVEYLAVGTRAAGIGPTLAPGTAATAVRADPPFASSSGDLVQVWAAGETGPERVATAELRGTGEDVVTLALDEQDAEALDPGGRYRLVTLPADPRPEREFAALLRAADETMGVVTVAEGSALDGAAVGSLDPTVVAVRHADGDLEAIPPRGYALGASDTVYAIARPEALRRLESSAGKAEPSS